MTLGGVEILEVVDSTRCDKVPRHGERSRGARICRRITRRYAKTFYFASHCLPRPTRHRAYAIYAFCRWADNAVDNALDRSDAENRLDRARDALAKAYGVGRIASGLGAFRDTVRDRRIPRDLFEALLDGMEMDLDRARYDDFEALSLYCYRVAGVVGLMMTHVFGYTNDRCLPNALALGTAMQLTNILRDVAEDAAMGRIYIPRTELERFGVTESQISEGRADSAFRSLMKFQIERARRYYDLAELGVPNLVGASSRLTVRVMGRLYAGILSEIERLDGDVFRARAHVPIVGKLRTLAACQIEGWREESGRFWG